MLHWLGTWLREIYGPFRLLTSRAFLMGLGTGLTAIGTWWLLPKLWKRLPRDRGREHAVAAVASVGKPVGAGLIFTTTFVAVSLLVIPPNVRILELLAVTLLAAVEGFLDDRTPGGWPEYRIAVADAVVSVLGAAVLCQFAPVTIWLPVLTEPITLPAWIYLPVAACEIWLSINATNCTDGVDGLSGSLLLLALFYLGIILYTIIGHTEVARYLRVPYSPQASWDAGLAFLIDRKSVV